MAGCTEGARNSVQKHQRNGQKRSEVSFIHEKKKYQNHRGGKEIQRHHNIPLIQPVCDYAADRG